MNKNQDIIALARKRGSDADLLLLDKIHELQDQIAALPTDDAKVEKIAARLAAKMAALEKGEKGDSIQGPQGIEGPAGKDSIVAGPQGRQGDKGEPGQDGLDGLDGAPGKDADETKILAEITKLRNEIEERIAQFESISKTSAAGGTPIVYGPGKTKLIVLDLSASLDGVTKTFQLGTNFGIVSVSSSGAPFSAFRPVIDYNGVGKTIVFTSSVDAPTALAAGQSLIVTILK